MAQYIHFTDEQRESVQNLGCAAEPSHSWRATYMPQSSAF